MGINWGIALGSAANAAMNTYERLGEEELRAMQRKKLKEEMENDAALAAAIKKHSSTEDFSKVTSGQDVGAVAEKALNFTPEQMSEFKSGLSKLTTEQQQNVLRAYAGTEHDVAKQTAIPVEGQPTPQPAGMDLSKINVYQGKEGQALATTEAGQKRSGKDIYKDVAAEMAATGNIRGYKEALGIKNAARESDLADAFDALQKKQADSYAKIHGIAESGGMRGLAEEAEKEGIKVRFTAGKNGVGKIDRLGPKGDVIQTFTDTNSAVNALVGAVNKRFESEAVSLLGSADKVLAYMQNKEKIEISRKEAEDKGIYYRAAAAKASSGGSGGSNSATNQEKVLTMKAEALMKGQPGRFKDVDSAKAWLVNSAAKGSDVDKQWDKLEVEHTKLGARPNEINAAREQYYSSHGFAPPSAINAARENVNPVTKKPFTEDEKKAFYKKWPNTAIEFGQ